MTTYVITPESFDGFIRAEKLLLRTLKGFRKAASTLDAKPEEQEKFDDRMDELNAAISDLEFWLKDATPTPEFVEDIFDMAQRATDAMDDIADGIIG